MNGPKLILSTVQLNWYISEYGEYSCSLPTGTTIGKRWMRNANAFNNLPRDSWFMGEYVEIPDNGYVGIIWTKIIVWDEDLHNCRRVMET